MIARATRDLASGRTIIKIYIYFFIWVTYGKHNPVRKRNLIVNVWPHHQCKKCNEKTYYVDTRSGIGCFIRTPYSWFGAFDRNKYYRHESSITHSEQKIDEWGGTLVTYGVAEMDFLQRVHDFTPSCWDRELADPHWRVCEFNTNKMNIVINKLRR